MADAIVDRIKHGAHKITLKGESMRHMRKFRQFAQRCPSIAINTSPRCT